MSNSTGAPALSGSPASSTSTRSKRAHIEIADLQTTIAPSKHVKKAAAVAQFTNLTLRSAFASDPFNIWILLPGRHREHKDSTRGGADTILSPLPAEAFTVEATAGLSLALYVSSNYQTHAKIQDE